MDHEIHANPGVNAPGYNVPMLKRALGIVLLALAFALGGCVVQQQYRTERTPFAGADPSVPTNRSIIETNPLYELVFVEVDDQGVLWKRRDAAYALDHVHAAVTANGSAGAMMLTFVHGWKHNAAPEDSNVGLFRAILQSLAVMEASLATNEGRAPRKIIGTYVGWRGYPITSTLGLWNLSIYDRKKTAEIIGSRGLLEVLARLEGIRDEEVEQERRALAQRVELKERFAPTRLITIGHSLGGTVLYHALGEVFHERLASAPGMLTEQPRPNVDVVVHGYGDLTVLINPAFEALQFNAVRDALLDIPQFGLAQRPFLAFLTSEADKATKVLFPLSRFTRNLKDAYRQRGDPDLPLDERKADITAIGHYVPFRSHALSIVDGAFDGKAENASFRGWIAGAPSLQVVRLPHPPGTVPVNSVRFEGCGRPDVPRQPILNIGVSRYIIADHSIPAVNTPGYDALADAVAGLIRLNDYPVDEDLQRRRDDATRQMQATMQDLLRRER